jgi:hypothetical protein
MLSHVVEYKYCTCKLFTRILVDITALTHLRHDLRFVFLLSDLLVCHAVSFFMTDSIWFRMFLMIFIFVPYFHTVVSTRIDMIVIHNYSQYFVSACDACCL